MRARQHSNYSAMDEGTMTCQERDIMSKRREYVQNYKPPVWTSPSPDPVSGQVTEVPMVTRASKY